VPQRGWAGDPILSLYGDMSRLFDDVLRVAAPRVAAGPGIDPSVLVPDISVSETDSEIRITVEMPGVNEGDIEVSLDDNVLTIRGEKKLERRDDRENMHVMERAFGVFQRSLRLPFPVDPQQVQARVENGVLTIAVPKTPAHEQSRRIQVQGAGGMAATDGGREGQAAQAGAQGGAQGGSAARGRQGGEEASAGEAAGAKASAQKT
jgi:HSP20 family protein